MGERVYLDIDDAADFLGTTVRNLRHLVQTRQIPFTKLGGKLRFDRRRLDDFLKARTTEVA